MATAISNIEIIQDNIFSNSNLLPVHAPSIFLAEATYTGDYPDYLIVNVYDINDNLIDTLKAYYAYDTAINKRVFRFIANDFIKAHMPKFDDFTQSNGTFVFCSNMTAQFKIEFADAYGSEFKDDVTVVYSHALAQFGDKPNLDKIYFNNFQLDYFCNKDEGCYVYFFNNQENQYISIRKNDNIFIPGTTYPEVGFYRLKTTFTEDSIIEFSTDGGEFYSNITVLNECEGLRFKYLDHFGQYRFYTLNKYYEISEAPTQIGSVENDYYSILEAKSDRKNIGYKNTRIIQGTVEVPSSHLEVLSQLYDSPKVYLYLETSQADDKWIEVEIKASENTIRRKKDNFGYINFTITLPERFTITLI